MLLGVSPNLQEKTCARVSFLIKLQTEACDFIKKETLAKAFSCEFYKIHKNISGGCLLNVKNFMQNYEKIQVNDCLSDLSLQLY